MKYSIIGLDDNPPNWVLNKRWQWVEPHKIVIYLGIPFFVHPSLKDMRNWIYNKVENNHIKWKSRILPLAQRAQVVQKVLFSHVVYYSLAWLFSN